MGASLSISLRNGVPAPVRCRCPITSSRVRGRIRTASGAAAWAAVSSASSNRLADWPVSAPAILRPYLGASYTTVGTNGCWRIRQGTGNRYLDNLYEEFGVGVELDGTAAHPADEQWRDKRRDNANAIGGIITLRFGFADLGDRRCETAANVAA